MGEDCLHPESSKAGSPSGDRVLVSVGGRYLSRPWLLGLRVAEAVKEVPYRWARSPLDFPFAAFLALALVSGFLSPLPGVALGSWVLAALAFVVVLQTALDVLHDAPNFVRLLHRAFSLSTLCAAISGLLIFEIYTEHVNRAQLFNLGPNALGFGLMAGILLSAPLLEAPSPWPILALCTVIASTMAVFATFSRAAFYGLMAGGLAYLWFRRHRLRLRPLLAGAVGMALGLLLVLTNPVFLRPLAGHLHPRAGYSGPPGGTVIVEKTLEYLFSTEGCCERRERVPIWRTALTVIRNYPLFGVGLGVFPFVVRKWAQEVPGASWIPNGTPPHSIYLNMGAETGIPGAIAFLAMPLVAIAWALKRQDAYRSGATASLIGMLVAEFRDNILIGFHMSVGLSCSWPCLLRTLTAKEGLLSAPAAATAAPGAPIIVRFSAAGVCSARWGRAVPP